MYVDTYQHPYELQCDEVEALENLAPNDRDENGPREEMLAPMRRYDEAGRVPYEDLC